MIDFNKYPVIKTMYTFVLAGNWTNTAKINTVKEINNIPKTANHASCYDSKLNVTTIEIYVIPEFDHSTGELIPLCHWLSHDTCILENICCDGKGRCKCIIEEGDNNERILV